MVGSTFICKALTLCRTRLSLLFARGPLTDDVRSSFVGSRAADGGEATETDRVNDAPFGATRSTTLCLVVVEIARFGVSVGAAGIGIVGGGARAVGERPPTGRGEGGKLFRKTDPDLRRVATREGEAVETGEGSFRLVPLGVETSTPLGNTVR